MAYTRLGVTSITNRNKRANAHALLCHYSVARCCSPAVQPPHGAACHYTTDHLFIWRFLLWSRTFFAAFCHFFHSHLCSHPFLLLALSCRCYFIPSVFVSGRAVSVSPALLPCDLRSRVRHLYSFTPAPTVSLVSSSISSSPERPDAPRLGSARHSHIEIRVPSAAFCVLTNGRLPSVPQVAT